MLWLPYGRCIRRNMLSNSNVCESDLRGLIDTNLGSFNHLLNTPQKTVCRFPHVQLETMSAVIVRSCHSNLQAMNSIAIPMRLLVDLRSRGVAAAAAERASHRFGIICFSKSSRRSSAVDSKESSKSCQSLGRTLIWFHHIKSSKKKRDIKEWGDELKLGGYCKPGFPGVLIFEGEAQNVAEYVRRIKRLRWQHLQIRGQDEEAVMEGQDLDSRRRFPMGVKELPESGMSELAQKCREADLERLYLTAFKIS